MAKKKKETSQEEARIYIGPTIREFHLLEDSIYIGESENIKKAFEKYPLAKKMLVDVEEIQKRGEEKYKSIYRKLKKEIGGK